jgi:hypothetical protein
MTLKDTINAMRQHLSELSRDLEKAVGGNRAAAQRVRTGTIHFAKIAKVFRKESISAEKGAGKKKGGKTLKKNLVKSRKKN